MFEIGSFRFQVMIIFPFELSFPSISSVHCGFWLECSLGLTWFGQATHACNVGIVHSILIISWQHRLVDDFGIKFE